MEDATDFREASGLPQSKSFAPLHGWRKFSQLASKLDYCRAVSGFVIRIYFVIRHSSFFLL
jgi:hypothetical protein